MRQKIESQEWRFREQIPTLEELEKEYQVSRITLRGALNQLEEQGIGRRTRGLGTFVAKDLSKQRWFKLATSSDELVEIVANLKIRLLAIDDESEHPLIPAFPFGEVGPSYQRLRRVHYHNDEPYCLIEIYLDKKIFDSDPEAYSNTPVVPQLAARRPEALSSTQKLRFTASSAASLRMALMQPCTRRIDPAVVANYQARRKRC
ncbi:MAG: GntR family transcriptional regulator [Burkholderiales bacterium]